MISMCEGRIVDVAQLTNDIPLTPQDQLALSKAMSNGIVLLRALVASCIGNPVINITGIECSFYNPWGQDDSAGPVYVGYDFSTSPITLSGFGTEAGIEHPMVDLTPFKELGVFPNLIKLKLGSCTLSDENSFWGSHIGVLMSAPS